MYKYPQKRVWSRKHRDVVIVVGRRWPEALQRLRPVLSTNDSMSDINPLELEAIELDEPEQIDTLAALDVGDRVRIDERRRPLTVVNLGTRVKGDKRIDEEVQVRMVRLEGHWPGAREVVLTHQLDRTPFYDEDDQVRQRLDVNDAIVDMDLGREHDVRRTHVVGSAGRAAGNGQEVSA